MLSDLSGNSPDRKVLSGQGSLLAVTSFIPNTICRNLSCRIFKCFRTSLEMVKDDSWSVSEKNRTSHGSGDYTIWENESKSDPKNFDKIFIFYKKKYSENKILVKKIHEKFRK